MTREEKIQRLQQINAQISAIETAQEPPQQSLSEIAIDQAKKPITQQFGELQPVIQKGFDALGEKTAEGLASGASLRSNPLLPPPLNVTPENTPGEGLRFPPKAAAAVGTAIQMTPDIVQSTAGLENPFKGMKATGPLTAGLKMPETVFPGELGRANEALGAAKGAARVGENAAEASRLRSMLLGGKTKIVKLAEEGKKVLEQGGDASVTHLLAYREALGKAQSLGGTFANDYKLAFDKASALLAKKAPDVSEALSRSAANYVATEGPEFGMPFLTTAVNPAVGAIKAGYNAMQMAPIRNAIGAGMNMATRTTPAIISAFQRLAEKKKRKK